MASLTLLETLPWTNNKKAKNVEKVPAKSKMKEQSLEKYLLNIKAYKKLDSVLKSILPNFVFIHFQILIFKTEHWRLRKFKGKDDNFECGYLETSISKQDE
jgi:hypothetical protein